MNSIVSLLLILETEKQEALIESLCEKLVKFREGERPTLRMQLYVRRAPAPPFLSPLTVYSLTPSCPFIPSLPFWRTRLPVRLLVSSSLSRLPSLSVHLLPFSPAHPSVSSAVHPLARSFIHSLSRPSSLPLCSLAFMLFPPSSFCPRLPTHSSIYRLARSLPHALTPSLTQS